MRTTTDVSSFLTLIICKPSDPKMHTHLLGLELKCFKRWREKSIRSWVYSTLQFDILQEKKARCGNKVSEMISCGVNGADTMEVLKSGAYLSFERMCRRIKHIVESKRPVHCK